MTKTSTYMVGTMKYVLGTMKYYEVCADPAKNGFTWKLVEMPNCYLFSNAKNKEHGRALPLQVKIWLRY